MLGHHRQPSERHLNGVLLVRRRLPVLQLSKLAPPLTNLSGSACLANNFCSENVVCFLRLLHIFLLVLLIMEANPMDLDQTALRVQTDLGLYCLQ